MGIEHIFGELKGLKKVVKYLYKSKDPKKSLEEIIEITKKTPILNNLLKVNKTYEMILRAEEKAEEKGWNYACEEAVKEMGVNYEIMGAKNIPINGKTLYISNHIYGILDGTILLGGLGSLLSKEKRKLKIIVTDQLRFIKGFEEVAYFINSKANLSSIRESLRHLDNGGDLAMYPSGRVSKTGLKEYPWKNGLGAFVSHSSYIVPMWFSGPNHAKIYNLVARNKRTEKLRGIFSLKETWNKVGKTVILNIGKPIKSELLGKIGNTEERVQYLRNVAESLKVAV